MTTYKVGLLVDGYEQPGWMHEMVEWLLHSQEFELTALLVMNGEVADSAPRLSVKALFGRLSRMSRQPAAGRHGGHSAGARR
jgi:hypothetical protein